MAEALLEMEFLDLDSNDDWADDILNEIQSDVKETSIEVEEVFGQVSLTGLIDICTRISDTKINITEESLVASQSFPSESRPKKQKVPISSKYLVSISWFK
ncbi:hypothetical protein AC249_AIPGENE27888 [Exaiptasia diaphana]|nr:hypothetical protein AC249_AIPGENE27888 [Exaiptasia diaphana]